MKIPETSANVGAYYGSEENGQWQPNGVIIDSGVGGGVVGSGDAGIHRPPVYPVHMPRAQVPAGYVVAGAYFPGAPFAGVAPAPPDDFADYMWMENEEEFDKQVMQQLEEEALMEQCIEAMLEDEQRERTHRNHNGHKHPTTSNGGPSLSLEETVSRSTLNPLAAEFVPTTVRQQPTEEDRAAPQDPPEAPAVEKERDHLDPPPAPADSTPDNTQEVKTEEPTPPQKDPPEVSAADVQPIAEKALDKRPKDPKKDSRPKQDLKKPVKVDPKPKAKPQVVKSETKVQPKKKEVKSVKSEVKVEEKRTEVKEEKIEEVPVQSVVEEQPKAQTPPIEETASGPKPINYAAAARANKPKPPSALPASDKAAPQPKAKPADKKDKKPEKLNVHRKNSTK